jgi:hypothetical protein
MIPDVTWTFYAEPCDWVERRDGGNVVYLCLLIESE